MTMSSVHLEIDLKEIFQMGNKMSKILTAELFLLFEMGSCSEYQQSSQSNENRSVKSFFTMELIEVKMTFSIHCWCECKMGSTFVENSLAISEFKTYTPLVQF